MSRDYCILPGLRTSMYLHKLDIRDSLPVVTDASGHLCRGGVYKRQVLSLHGPVPTIGAVCSKGLWGTIKVMA